MTFTVNNQHSHRPALHRPDMDQHSVERHDVAASRHPATHPHALDQLTTRSEATTSAADGTRTNPVTGGRSMVRIPREPAMPNAAQGAEPLAEIRGRAEAHAHHRRHAQASHHPHAGHQAARVHHGHHGIRHGIQHEVQHHHARHHAGAMRHEGSGGVGDRSGGAPRRARDAEQLAPRDAGAPRGNGSLRQNQQEAYRAALKEGLSPTAARALVANMTGEALHKPRDHHWDVHHMSQGICQWDPQRAAAIKRQFGKLPKDMTVGEQTRAAVWEMKHKYPQTYRALQGRDPGRMMQMLVRDFERPANPSAEIMRRMGHYNRLGGLSAGERMV